MSRKEIISKICIFVDVKYKILFGKESLFVTRGNYHLVLVPVLDNDRAFCRKC